MELVAAGRNSAHDHISCFEGRIHVADLELTRAAKEARMPDGVVDREDHVVWLLLDRHESRRRFGRDARFGEDDRDALADVADSSPDGSEHRLGIRDVHRERQREPGIHKIRRVEHGNDVFLPRRIVFLDGEQLAYARRQGERAVERALWARQVANVSSGTDTLRESRELVPVWLRDGIHRFVGGAVDAPAPGGKARARRQQRGSTERGRDRWRRAEHELVEEPANSFSAAERLCRTPRLVDRIDDLPQRVKRRSQRLVRSERSSDQRCFPRP